MVSAIVRVLDLVYPVRCLVCDGFLRGDPAERAILLHTACADKLVYSHLSPRLLPAAPHLDSTFAPFAYSQLPIQHSIVSLKYRGRTSLAVPLAHHLATAVRASGFGAGADAIVACPLPLARRRKRGYNQSALLARALATELHLALIPEVPPAVVTWVLSAAQPDVFRRWHEIWAWGALRQSGVGASWGGLVRVRYTRPQVGLKAQARASNVAGAFCWYGDTVAVAGKNIIVVDDVRTTGATLDACAVALLEAGADRVWGLTLAG